METIHLKIRGPNAVVSLAVSKSITFGELKKKIGDDLRIEVPFDLLIGFPPAIASQPDTDTILGVIG